MSIRRQRICWFLQKSSSNPHKVSRPLELVLAGTCEPHASIFPSALSFLIARIRGRFVHQIDVFTTSLNGDLLEEVYLRQSPGFTHSDLAHKVRRLHCSLYDLAQSPYWSNEIDSKLRAFRRCPVYFCVYAKKVLSSDFIFVTSCFVDQTRIRTRFFAPNTRRKTSYCRPNVLVLILVRP